MNKNKNIFLIKSSKAQASAPFEVLVAVILMGFVIMAGTWALINLNQSVCVGNKRQSMSEMKGIIEDIIMGSDLAVKNVKFDIQPCFNEKFEAITLKTYTNETLCTSYCNAGETCTLMEYVYDDDKTTKRPIAPMCLNLPTAINYASSAEGCEENSDEWLALNFGGSNPNSILTSGSYKIFMRSQTGTDSIRELCFLKKID
jgi:hypothetical protein